MTNTPTNSDDVIDSRDVIEAIAALEAELEEAEGDRDLEADILEQLDPLRELAEQGKNHVADWQWGEVLVRDSYFEEHAKQLADDIGAIDAKAGWPMMHIDWKAAAIHLQEDYTDLDFDGVTYWARP